MQTASQAMLTGNIFDDVGQPMCPSFAVKNGVRYRYYASSVLAQGRKEEAGSVARVPAPDIEEVVRRTLLQHLAKPKATSTEDSTIVGLTRLMNLSASWAEQHAALGIRQPQG